MDNKDIAEKEKRQYMELNHLTEQDLTELDKENIKFNIEYALEKAEGSPPP